MNPAPHILQLISDPVGDDQIGLLLELFQVADHRGVEELGRVEGWFVKNSRLFNRNLPESSAVIPLTRPIYPKSDRLLA